MVVVVVPGLPRTAHVKEARKALDGHVKNMGLGVMLKQKGTLVSDTAHIHDIAYTDAESMLRLLLDNSKHDPVKNPTIYVSLQGQVLQLHLCRRCCFLLLVYCYVIGDGRILSRIRRNILLGVVLLNNVRDAQSNSHSSSIPNSLSQSCHDESSC